MKSAGASSSFLSMILLMLVIGLRISEKSFILVVDFRSRSRLEKNS